MISRIEREKELTKSGLVDAIKHQYNGIPNNIPNEYFILIADYIDSMSQIDNLNVDYMSLARNLPNILKKVQEQDLGGIYGRTDNDVITMDSSLDYETKKTFFFHELTHILQKGKVNEKESCGFYNGNTGMFFTEGATQFMAEILYHVSNDTNLNYRQQPNVITGQPQHIPFSPLRQYQFNGSMLYMFSLATKIPLNQLLGLGFNPNGRQIIKESFEQLDGNAGMFEEFMFDLEKIHTIEKLSWFGHGNQLANPMPTNITLAGGATFDGNFQVQDELMNKTQRNLMASFILNNDEYYILANYEKVLNSLTTETLKTDFANAIAEIRAMTDPQSLDQRGGGRGQ